MIKKLKKKWNISTKSRKMFLHIHVLITLLYLLGQSDKIFIFHDIN